MVVAPYFSAPSRVTDAGTPTAFTNASPFTVTGTVGNGNSLVITRSSGTFAAKTFGTGAPQFFDTVDHQYVNGVDQNAYAGFTDGTTIAHLVYGRQSSDNGAGTDVTKWYTSRTRRTGFTSASYASVNMQLAKGIVGFPKWPAAYGTQNNQTLYFSGWGKCDQDFDQSQAAGGHSTKFLRVSDTTFNSTIQGNNFSTNGGMQFPSPFASSTQGFLTINGYSGTWVRYEMWHDLTNGICNFWLNGAFVQCSYSGLGGTFEFSHPADVLYTSNKPTNSYWNPGSDNETFDAVCAGSFGIDNGHGGFVNANFDIDQVYCDPNIQRFEISDQGVWSTGPSSTMNREVQGKWTRDSTTQCTVTQSFGQFASISGKYLWYVKDRSTAEQVGQFV